MRMRLKSQKGSMLLIMAAGMIPLIALAAVAVDLGMAYLISTDLSKAADLAALGAMRKFADSAAGNVSDNEIYNAANNTAKQNPIRGQNAPSSLTRADVEAGIYSFTTRTFTPTPQASDPGVNAVRVTIRQAPDADSLFFAKALGFAQYFFTRTAVAAYGGKQIYLSLDVSSSMDDQNYPAYAPDPTAVCPGVQPPYDKTPPTIPLTQLRRNFKYAARTNYDNVNCLGGMPEPQTSIIQSIRDNFLMSELFDTFYTAGLAVFGSEAKTLVPMGKNNNKNDISKEINNALNDLTQYAQTNTAAPDYTTIKISPGGADPLGETGEQTGYTNIGGSIQNAMDQFQKLGNTAFSVKVMFLLTDGHSNCEGPSANSCGPAVPGVWYAIDSAREAAGQGIIINTIYYDQLGPCQREDDISAFDNLYDIANVTNGRFICASNIQDLKDELDNLNETPPIVLADAA